MQLYKTTCFYLFLILVSGCETRTTKSGNQNSLTIAGATNIQFALKDLIAEFEAESGISCNSVISSSGKITAQIQQGAPYDIFVSANLKYPRELYEKGYALAPPRVYAEGKLVLWSLRKGYKPTLEGLKSDSIKRIAVANPKTAPYGEAAIGVLQKHQLYQEVRDKIVFGESISQINQFITTGAVQVGFTSKSTVLSPKIRNMGNWTEVDEGSYEKITQGAVIIKRDNQDTVSCLRFYKFLFSPKAKMILEGYGYQVELNK